MLEMNVNKKILYQILHIISLEFKVLTEFEISGEDLNLRDQMFSSLIL